jgi:hypothetical protein
MKRLVLVAFLFMALVFSAIGCGSGGGGEATPQPSQTPISSPIPSPTSPPPTWWPIRDLPDNPIHPTETFDVVVTFAAPWDSFNSIEIVDNVPTGWAIQVDKVWCTPNADSHDVTANQTQYTWYGPYGAGQTFSALYKVTVPGNTSSSSYEFTGQLAYKIGSSNVTFVTTGGYRQVTVEVPTPTPIVTPTPASMAGVEIYIKSVDPEASEIGPDTGRFYVYTEQPLCGKPSGHCADGWQKIFYTIKGTAQNGVDYEQISGCVYALVGYPIVPPPSDAPVEYIDIKPIPDNVVEGNETVRLVLGNGRSAEVIIRDGPPVTPTPTHTLN